MSAGKSEKDRCTALCEGQDSNVDNHQSVEQLTWNTAAEFIGELGDEIVVDAILEWPENDHGTRVLYRQLLHGLVREHVLFATCNRLIVCTRTVPRRAPEDSKRGKGRERGLVVILYKRPSQSLHRTFGGAHKSAHPETAEV